MRKPKHHSDKFSQILQKIEALKNTDLNVVASWLDTFMKSAASLPEDCMERHDIIEYVAKISEKLPIYLSRRFMFDAYMLTTIMEAWDLSSNGNVILVPTYSSTWGYECFKLWSDRYIGFVHIPDNSENCWPDLLEYTWFIHELGHHVIKFEGKSLIETYKALFIDELLQLRLRAGADRGIAQTITQRKLESYDKFWSPESKWPYEIMTDSIALWCSGKAYLTTYYEAHKSLDPFHITFEHPPIELRTKALIYAAHKLGWKNSCTMLERLLTSWDGERQSASSEFNAYNAARHLNLMSASVDCAINFCRKISLLHFTNHNQDLLEQVLLKGVDIDTGIELIVAARRVYELHGDIKYESWISEQFDLIA